MSSISQKRRLIVFNKYNGRCAYCGCNLDFKDMQPDHIIPLATIRRIPYNKLHEVGIRVRDEVNNLNPSCADCNRYKRDLSIEEFRLYLLKRFNTLCLDGMYKMAAKYGGKMVRPENIVFYFEKQSHE